MNKIIFFLLGMALLTGCSQQSEVLNKFIVHNNVNHFYQGVIEIPLVNIPEVKVNSPIEIIVENTPKAYQWCDKSGDGVIDCLLAEVYVGANDSVQIEITLKAKATEFPKKTHAELWHKTTGKFKEGQYVGGGNFYRFDTLRVPDGFMDHAYFIKYEGPGWESDKVGYRFYLDWRNAVDVFGKKVAKPVLQDVGLDGYESYHHPQDWGMDVLKVGKSLGIGSIAWWDGEQAVRVEKTDSVICRVLSDGIIRSQVQTWHYGWEMSQDKTNLISVKSIDAGSRMTRESLSFDQEVSNVCTGIRIEPNTETIQLKGKNQQWACYATWGKQSLNNDLLGLAIVYPLSQEPLVTKDKNSHVIVFQNSSKAITYYYLAAWELEKGGVKTKKDFVDYLKVSLEHLEQPVLVTK